MTLERTAGEKKPIRVRCFFFCCCSVSTPTRGGSSAVGIDDVACSSLRLCSENVGIVARASAVEPPAAELEPAATGEAAGVTAGDSVAQATQRRH